MGRRVWAILVAGLLGAAGANAQPVEAPAKSPEPPAGEAAKQQSSKAANGGQDTDFAEPKSVARGDLQPGADRPHVDLESLTGKDFGGVRVAASVGDGPIELSAQKAWAWNEGEGAGATQRVLLVGDVRVRLGLYSFNAARAVVWLGRLPAADPDAAADVWQVFVYFDRVGTASDDAAVSVYGDRLPVQGVFRAEGGIGLSADVVTPRRPTDPLVREGERALGAYLRRVVRGEAEAAGGVQMGPGLPPLAPGTSRPYEPVLSEEVSRRLREVERRLPPAEREEPILAESGVLTFTSGDIIAAAAEDENVLVINSPVSVNYWEPGSSRTLEMTAQRAVVFLDPGPLAEMARFEVSKVRGIYLEGDVVVVSADEVRYNLRAPKVYYDVRNDRAVLIDAVFWTFEPKRGMPIYVRARTIRQESSRTFSATKASLSSSSFFKPQLALGMSSVTISQTPTEEDPDRMLVDATDITLKTGGLPFFYFPRYTGDPRAVPIRELRIESSSGSGTGVKTSWDAFALVGMEPPDGVRMEVFADLYFDRGPATGGQLSWGTESLEGQLFGYTLPYDQGEDTTSTGEKVGFNGDFRGILLGEHRADLGDGWSLQAELSMISDPTFVDAFFDTVAREHRELTSALALQRVRENSLLGLEVKTTFDDFIANEYLMQTPGYSVSRLPELGYYRLADDLLSESAPGLLTWSSDWRLGRMNMEFIDHTPAELGFTKPSQSQAAFGLDPDENIADAMKARGLSGSPVTRFDTRQELSAQTALGPVNVTPFLVGRFTGYDDDFSEFSPDADDPYRTWGAAGLALQTSFQHVDNSVESELFDLHRIRHIVEPGLMVWSGGGSIAREDLPVYDDTVESLAEGTTARVSLNQTWQTQRGAPGRWRSVDVFRLDASLVSSTDDVDPESPIGRFFDYRPEYSSLGDYATVDGLWQVSEAVGVAGGTVYDLDLHQPARTSVGGIIQQTPDFSTYADVRYINSQDQTYVSFGAAYQLTEKYAFQGKATYDTDNSEFQSFSADLRRRLPNVYLGVGVSYNNISDETSLGLLFTPIGPGGPVTSRFQGWGAAERSRSSSVDR